MPIRNSRREPARSSISPTLLEPFQEQPLATQFETLKTRNGVDFVVVTLPSLQGYSIETLGPAAGE